MRMMDACGIASNPVVDLAISDEKEKSRQRQPYKT